MSKNRWLVGLLLVVLLPLLAACGTEQSVAPAASATVQPTQATGGTAAKPVAQKARFLSFDAKG